MSALAGISGDISHGYFTLLRWITLESQRTVGRDFLLNNSRTLSPLKLFCALPNPIGAPCSADWGFWPWGRLVSCGWEQHHSADGTLPGKSVQGKPEKVSRYFRVIHPGNSCISISVRTYPHSPCHWGMNRNEHPQREHRGCGAWDGRKQARKKKGGGKGGKYSCGNEMHASIGQGESWPTKPCQ